MQISKGKQKTGLTLHIPSKPLQTSKSKLTPPTLQLLANRPTGVFFASLHLPESPQPHRLPVLPALSPPTCIFIYPVVSKLSLLCKMDFMNNNFIFSCYIHIKCSQQTFTTGFIILSLHWGKSGVQTEVLSLQNFVVNYYAMSVSLYNHKMSV